MIISPRQARDKHKETLKKERRFVQEGIEWSVTELLQKTDAYDKKDTELGSFSHIEGNENDFLAPFYAKHCLFDRFAKAGSGQTWEKLSKKVLSLGLWPVLAKSCAKVRKHAHKNGLYQKMRSFYQDRLGTDVGNALLKKRDVFHAADIPQPLGLRLGRELSGRFFSRGEDKNAFNSTT
jgi:hypothetical protein|eukprot:COSAG06_NODE_7388_length_2521_cov_101.388522_3_plen_179_part_00